jgi:dolichyl-phosphate-mannose-protein mannosyltransferase
MTTEAAGRSAARTFRINRDWIPLAALLLAGLIVRFWAMRWPPFPNDMASYIAWGERMRALGPGAFYAEDVFADYAPGYIYVFWFTSIFQNAFFDGASTGVIHFLYRFPPVLSDLATTAIIYFVVLRLVRERTDEAAESAPLWSAVAAACYAFNPAVIFNSSAWGQTDSVFTLFMLVAFLLLLGDRPVWSMLVFAVAFLVKPQAISIAPVLGVGLLTFYPPRRVAAALGAGLALGIALIVPFFGLDFVRRFLDVLRNATDVYPYTSLWTYNLWGIYGFWKDDRVGGFLGMTPRQIGLVLYLLAAGGGVAWLVYELRRTTDRFFTMLMFAVYFTFLPVMVLTRMHERYLYPLFAFLLLFATLCQLKGTATDPEERDLRFLGLPFVLYVLLTVLHTMNLYQVYEYYRAYPNPVPLTNTLFYRIGDNARVWSVLTLLGFWAFVVCMPSWLDGSRRRELRNRREALTPGPSPVATGEGSLQ